MSTEIRYAEADTSSLTQQETISTVAWMASTSKTKLPGHDGPGVKVHLLDGGSFSTASMKLLHKNGSHEPFRMYDWCFLIHHQPSNRYVLWDLGCNDVCHDLLSLKSRSNIGSRTTRCTHHGSTSLCFPMLML
jgi:hypothetical protein